MHIDISGQQLEVTPALKGYVNEKFDRLQRHLDRIDQVHVVLSVAKKFQQRAEAHICVKGADIFANCEEEDMYAAIDSLVDKLDRQVVKYKEKLKAHHKH